MSVLWGFDLVCYERCIVPWAANAPMWHQNDMERRVSYDMHANLGETLSQTTEAQIHDYNRAPFY